MNILTMLWKNLWGGNRTMLFPQRPKVDKGFRGLIKFDPEHCSGCAICKFRCTAKAIDIKPGKGEFTWSYDAGQCTFCGRCVEGCIEHAQKDGHEEHALSQESNCPPIYLHQGELKESYTVARKKPAPKAPAAAPAASPGSETAQGGTQ
jgi:Formate hydrogenlyase subunit 6/NADH:ubiquinone oxidoreductase 23 kD subunit (chain I)